VDNHQSRVVDRLLIGCNSPVKKTIVGGRDPERGKVKEVTLTNWHRGGHRKKCPVAFWKSPSTDRCWFAPDMGHPLKRGLALDKL